MKCFNEWRVKGTVVDFKILRSGRLSDTSIREKTIGSVTNQQPVL